jgi:ATP-binding cassette subfamily F protein 3
MLAILNISKSYSVKTVLSQVSFTVKPRERVALVGPNGCGKTTLLRILTGELKPDQGSVRTTPGDLRLGYLPQGLHFGAQETIGDYLNHYRGNVDFLAEQLAHLSAQLAAQPEDDDLQLAYDVVLNNLQDSAMAPDRGPEVLKGLGLAPYPEDTPIAHLSGGQKTRLALAGVLLSSPQFLLLDEPTNHLDIQMIEWLEDWLALCTSPALFVSHDRAFIDAIATSVLELDPSTHQVREYTGNYSAYLEQKQTEQLRQQQEYVDQQEELARLAAAAAHLRGIARFRKGGKADSGDKFAKGFFANRGQGTIGRAKAIERRIDLLTTEDKVKKPRRTWQVAIDFSQAPASGKDVLTLEELVIGYDPDHPLAGPLDLTIRAGQRIALIGPNGAGKSTLVKTILSRVPALGGQAHLGANVQPGYMAQEQENLREEDTPLSALLRIKSASETEVRSFLSKFLITGDDVFTPVQRMSYGERARLSLAGLVGAGCNFLLLDEPINHLDIPSRVRFEEALRNFDGAILAVVHDRYFIQAFATGVWELAEQQIHIVA